MGRVVRWPLRRRPAGDFVRAWPRARWWVAAALGNGGGSGPPRRPLPCGLPAAARSTSGTASKVAPLPRRPPLPPPAVASGERGRPRRLEPRWPTRRRPLSPTDRTAAGTLPPSSRTHIEEGAPVYTPTPLPPLRARWWPCRTGGGGRQGAPSHHWDAAGGRQRVAITAAVPRRSARSRLTNLPIPPPPVPSHHLPVHRHRCAPDHPPRLHLRIPVLATLGSHSVPPYLPKLLSPPVSSPCHTSVALTVPPVAIPIIP